MIFTDDFSKWVEIYLLQQRPGLPGCFWSEVVNTLNHIQNRCQSKSLVGKTPFKLWTRKVLNVHYLREFEYATYVLNLQPTKEKLHHR